MCRMSLTHPDLWARIGTLELDAPDASLPYSGKLAEAEGWSAGDTARVAAEYRRFLQLSQSLDEAPVPTAPIDAVRQAQLTYTICTLSCWNDLVPGLPTALHSDPDLRDRHSALRKQPTGGNSAKARRPTSGCRRNGRTGAGRSFS